MFVEDLVYVLKTQRHCIFLFACFYGEYFPWSPWDMFYSHIISKTFYSSSFMFYINKVLPCISSQPLILRVQCWGWLKAPWLLRYCAPAPCSRISLRKTNKLVPLFDNKDGSLTGLNRQITLLLSCAYLVSEDSWEFSFVGSRTLLSQCLIINHKD